MSTQKLTEKMINLHEDDFSEEEMMKILEKAQKKKRKGTTYRNEMHEDFQKGNVRNLPCPCGSGKKIKKCDCGLWS